MILEAHRRSLPARRASPQALVFSTASGRRDTHMLRALKRNAKKAGLNPDGFWLHAWLWLKRDPSDDRTGVFTSGIVSVGQGWKVALYFTGNLHAGENIAGVLKQRRAELPSPIQCVMHCHAMSHGCLREYRMPQCIGISNSELD